MIVREAKLKNGTIEQYSALDQAIQTAQFIRNKAVRFWMDNEKVSKANLYTLCKDLAKEFPFAKKLNSAARQASVERAWVAISSFYARCKQRLTPVGSPDHGSETATQLPSGRLRQRPGSSLQVVCVKTRQERKPPAQRLVGGAFRTEEKEIRATLVLTPHRLEASTMSEYYISAAARSIKRRANV